MTPLALLTKELNSYKKALKKSNQDWFAKKISYVIHDIHRGNLYILIKQYEEAIKKLK